jgi:mRNA interferase MazF
VRHGRRFAVIVQADELPALSTVVICPTSSSTPPASFHPEVRVADEPTRVMCEMVGAVDAGALGERQGHLTLGEMRSIDDALQLVLDLR